jgi:hypothetical protein
MLCRGSFDFLYIYFFIYFHLFPKLWDTNDHRLLYLDLYMSKWLKHGKHKNSIFLVFSKIIMSLTYCIF